MKKNIFLMLFLSGIFASAFGMEDNGQQNKKVSLLINETYNLIRDGKNVELNTQIGDRKVNLEKRLEAIKEETKKQQEEFDAHASVIKKGIIGKSNSKSDNKNESKNQNELLKGQSFEYYYSIVETAVKQKISERSQRAQQQFEAEKEQLEEKKVGHEKLLKVTRKKKKLEKFRLGNQEIIIPKTSIMLKKELKESNFNLRSRE